MVAWIITIPAAATVAALFYWLISGLWTQLLIAVAVIAVAAGAAQLLRNRGLAARA